ncbi:hypothetical protein LPN01_18435 [Sphingomonas sp. A2-49]|uniref:hypothetical protein n=1 Tax=Sphingomonas sp. A2-49 TaxID=1391375 RepID=UPI0021D09BF2|nr:hypothetical protein [Sphingomonas sp. A2-49]MCU6456060.1 hypothetical protein [Sphingomonas sp. A2-49]
MAEILNHLLAKASSYRRLAEGFAPGLMQDSLLQTAEGYATQADLVAKRMQSEDF